MIIKSCSAWFIFREWTGDTSARAFFFTEHFGLLSCLYKGGRTPKKQALLQPFTPLWLNFSELRGRYYVRSIEQQAPALQLKGISLFSGLYLNELIYHALKKTESEPRLFQAYHMALNHLALTQESKKIEKVLRRFEWVLLQACGHHFSLAEEGITGEPVRAGRCYQYQSGIGLILADKGIPGAHLLALAVDDLSEDAFLKSAKQIMRHAIDNLLEGKEIKARSLFSKAVCRES
ncbi:MAG: DNA repair protein RecO [Legionella sp.]|nr:MAG: DNA repair protein RecO [Legionella sp.]PJD99633.1 MAG: DNA repair protein RecO [Legionella sp.]